MRRGGPFPVPGVAALVLAMSVSACQKVVSIDLNQSNPQVVIEGVVTDGRGPYLVAMGMTGDYFTPSLNFPPITNAVITISDDAGNRDSLRMVYPGLYATSTMQGVPGRTYLLHVQSGGRVYDAVSPMPIRVPIDSVYTQPFREFDGDFSYYIYIMFHDPPVVQNWYRLEVHSSAGSVDSSGGRRFILYSDRLANGLETTFRIRTLRRSQPGDSVVVRLYSIDKSMYDYYRTVNDILGSDRSPTSLAPANPNTNLSNGSLGYFAAYSIDSAGVVLR